MGRRKSNQNGYVGVFDQRHRQQNQFNEIATSVWPKELALPAEEEQFDNASKNIEVEISDNTSMIPKAKVLRYAPTFEGKAVQSEMSKIS